MSPTGTRPVPVTTVNGDLVATTAHDDMVIGDFTWKNLIKFGGNGMILNDGAFRLLHADTQPQVREYATKLIKQHGLRALVGSDVTIDCHVSLAIGYTRHTLSKAFEGSALMLRDAFSSDMTAHLAPDPGQEGHIVAFFEKNREDKPQVQNSESPADAAYLIARICAHCKNHEGSKLCGQCKAEVYCSKYCQKAQWATHRRNAMCLAQNNDRYFEQLKNDSIREFRSIC